MKKSGLFLLGMFFANIIIGQTIHIHVGPSISKLKWDRIGSNFDPLYNQTLLSYSVFGGIDYFDKKYMDLSSNIGMISKGGKDKFEYRDQNGEVINQELEERATLNYLSLNTMINFKYANKKAVTPFIGIGPRIDYLVKSSKEFDALEEIDELKRTSVGLIFGGGLNYAISKIQFGIRADYYLDFNKIANRNMGSENLAEEVSVNTTAISFKIGYML